MSGVSPRRLFRLGPSLLAGSMLVLLPSLASAGGAFDSTAHAGRVERPDGGGKHGATLSWHHRLGAGPNRVVVVGVSLETKDSKHPAQGHGHDLPPVALSVEFDHVPMLPVPGATAVVSGPHGSLSTQLFYLLDSRLKAAGTYPVKVSLPRGVEAATGGSISFVGLAQAPPEAVAGGVAGAKSREITTSLDTITPQAWLVDSVVAEGSDPLFPTRPSQTARYGNRGHGLVAAGGTLLAATPGTHSLGWRQKGKGRMAHVVAAFAPVTYPLSVTVVGSGSVEPPGGSFLEGTVVELVASAAPGHRFVGWGGDLGGTENPARLTMDSAKAVTATFVPLYELTVGVTGQGSVSRVPDAPLYDAFTVVALSATPAPGWQFAGWSGDITGDDNPTTISMDGPRNVVAAFTPDFALYGWATQNGGTTGGAGGPEVVVDTLADFKRYVQEPGPYVVKVYGTISGDENIRVYANKSILGVGSDARLRGIGLQIGWNSAFGQMGNVIIRNIRFEKALAPTDNVMIAYGAKNVWIDHCDFSSDRDHGIDYYDGLLDVNHGADFITVSWSRFHDHYKTTLVGNSDSTGDEDSGHLTVTYHHNSFVNSGGRNPSVRFGLVHVYNNYYRDLDDYAIASRMNAEVVVENNWFQNVNRPIRADTSLSPTAGFVSGVDSNVFVACTPNSITSPPATWLPPYAYPLYAVETVPEMVEQWSGVGVVVFEGEAPPPTPPTLTTEPQPASQTVETGADVSYSVAAAGSEPFSYQWFLDANPIAGATEPVLGLLGVDVADSGEYTVKVTNRGGTVESDPVVLTVNPPRPPVITTQPLSQTVLAGSALEFSVGASGTAPLSYQWRKDGSALAGATATQLALLNVQPSDAGSYTVEVSNPLGSATSDPAVLVVDTAPPGSVVAINDSFLDGERNTQALPDSAAWFTSSGSGNLVASVGQLEQSVSSSRTLLAYYTNDTATPFSLGAGQTVKLDFTFQFTGFDSAAPLADYTFRIGLLRSVANPAATSGTGFVANGPPNTNARVTGDFGSNNPTTGAFALYSGYAVFTSVNGFGTAAPIRFNARTGSSNNLLNSNAPFTTLPAAPATPSVPMEALVSYRGVFTLERTGGAIALTYTVLRASDNAVIMAGSAQDAAASMTEFDTLAFYLSKASASPTYALRLNSVNVTRTDP